MDERQPSKGLGGVVLALHSLYIAPLIVGVTLAFVEVKLKPERERLDPARSPSITPLPAPATPPLAPDDEPLKVNIAVLWRDYERDPATVLQKYGYGRLLEVSGDLGRLSDEGLKGANENYSLIVRDDDYLICEFDHRHGLWFQSLLSATVQGVLEQGQYSRGDSVPVHELRLAHSEITDLRLQITPLIVLILVIASVISLTIRWGLKRVGLL